MSGQCRVGVIGAGYIAREHLRAFAAIESVRIVGLQSRTRERAEALAREFGVPAVYDRIADMQDQAHPDLVVVAVSVDAMKPVVEASLAYSWALLVEKPPGLNVAEAGALAAAVRQSDRRVRVALNRASYSATRAVAGELAVRTGRRFVRVQDQQSLAAAAAAGHPELVRRHWRYANAIHLVDYFRIFCRGRVESVNVVQPWNAPEPGVVVAGVTFSSGDTGLYEAVWHAPGPWAVSVTLPDCRWEIRPLERATREDPGRIVTELPVAAADREFKPGFFQQANEAVALARGGPCALPTMDDALETMRLIERIYGE